MLVYTHYHRNVWGREEVGYMFLKEVCYAFQSYHLNLLIQCSGNINYYYQC